jgi:hypothetical protein
LEDLFLLEFTKEKNASSISPIKNMFAEKKPDKGNLPGISNQVQV